MIEKVLDEHVGWYRRSAKVDVDPSATTSAKVNAIVSALLQDFNVTADMRDARRYVDQTKAALLAEQQFALELVDANRAIDFDGPAGGGMSYLVARKPRSTP